MTKRDKLKNRKLAKAARELASEFAEGIGPTLDPGSWCGCAAGEVFSRAGVANELSDSFPWTLPAAIMDGAFGNLLTRATSAQCRYQEPIPGAVVFPLLALADKLEAEAR